MANLFPYLFGRCTIAERPLLNKRYFDLRQLKDRVLYVSISRVYESKTRQIRTAAYFIIDDNRLRDITLEIADLFDTKLDSQYKLQVPHNISVMVRLLSEKLGFDVNIQFPETY